MKGAKSALKDLHWRGLAWSKETDEVWFKFSKSRKEFSGLKNIHVKKVQVLAPMDLYLPLDPGPLADDRTICVLRSALSQL